MWSLRIQPSLMRRRLILAWSAFTAMAAGWVFWHSLQSWWLDWLWCWPLLLTSALCCWQQSNQRQFSDTLRISEQGRAYYASDAQRPLQVKQGLLTPFVVCVQFSCSQQRSTQQRRSQQRRNQQRLPWHWFYCDQLDSAGWARLRRICLNCQRQAAKSGGPVQRW